MMNTSVGKWGLFGDIAGDANQQIGELGAGGKLAFAEQIADFHDEHLHGQFDLFDDVA